MTCKCGTTAELRIFNTFQYQYCVACRVEVQPIEAPTVWQLTLGELFPDWMPPVMEQAACRAALGGFTEADSNWPPGFYWDGGTTLQYWKGYSWATEAELRALCKQGREGK